MWAHVCFKNLNLAVVRKRPGKNNGGKNGSGEPGQEGTAAKLLQEADGWGESESGDSGDTRTGLGPF